MTGSCVVIKEDGSKCGSIYQLNPIYLRDAHNILNKEVSICQPHKQKIFGVFKIKDNEALMKIRRLTVEVNSIRAYLMGKKTEDYDKMRKVGVTYRGETDIRNQLLEKERLIKKWYEIRTNLRDKTCRVCWHPLNCTCLQCQDRQRGNQFSSAMTYGQKGFRGEFYPLHTICGRILFQRFGFALLSTSTKNFTMDDYTKVI